MSSTWYYWDKETHEFKEGYPPDPNPKYGQAPLFMSDEMPKACYHEGACRYVSSRSEWNKLDKLTGMQTLGHYEPVKPKKSEAEKLKEIEQDIDIAIEKAKTQLDAGMAPLSEEQKAKHKEQNEYLTKKLGIDAHNMFRKGKNGKRK